MHKTVLIIRVASNITKAICNFPGQRRPELVTWWQWWDLLVIRRQIRTQRAEKGLPVLFTRIRPRGTMAASSNYVLPPPPALEVHDAQAADKWKKLRRAWTNYALPIELSAKSEAVQVATLLTVVGEEAREVFSTFSNWEHDGDEGKIGPVLEKFEKYCQPRKHVPFERYRFNRGTQEAGETYYQYRTALRKLSEGCEFETITPDEILRDRLVIGIRDVHVRGRMLRESGLTLKRTDEICHAAESMTVQLKQVEDSSDSGVSDNGVSAVAGNTETQQFEKPAEPKRIRECWNYGQRHEFQKELCPAYGKTCRKCRKPNHFAVKCHSRAAPSSVKAVEDRQEPGSADETFLMEVAMVTLDDSQFVTLRLKSGNHIRFQVDTGAQCNIVPLEVYKKAHSGLCHSITLADYSLWRRHLARGWNCAAPGVARNFPMSSRL